MTCDMCLKINPSILFLSAKLKDVVKTSPCIIMYCMELRTLLTIPLMGLLSVSESKRMHAITIKRLQVCLIFFLQGLTGKNDQEAALADEFCDYAGDFRPCFYPLYVAKEEDRTVSMRIQLGNMIHRRSLIIGHLYSTVLCIFVQKWRSFYSCHST